LKHIHKLIFSKDCSHLIVLFTINSFNIA
jgi:hypothetical protein